MGRKTQNPRTTKTSPQKTVTHYRVIYKHRVSYSFTPGWGSLLQVYLDWVTIILLCSLVANSVAHLWFVDHDVVHDFISDAVWNTVVFMFIYYSYIMCELRHVWTLRHPCTAMNQHQNTCFNTQQGMRSSVFYFFIERIIPVLKSKSNESKKNHRDNLKKHLLEPLLKLRSGALLNR